MPIQNQPAASPARLLEMLADRFGAFEAIAYSTIKLARHVSADELSIDPIVAEAILEFGEDLRSASVTAACYHLPEADTKALSG
jgi:hypothetical protein